MSVQATAQHAQAQLFVSLKSACRPQVRPTWSLKCEASTWSTTELKFTCGEWNGEGHMLCQRHMLVWTAQVAVGAAAMKTGGPCSSCRALL